MARRLELVLGLAAGAAGVIGFAYALFGATGSYERTETTSAGGAVVTTRGTTSMWSEQDFQGITIVFLAVMLLAILSVAGSAWRHHQYGHMASLGSLWLSTFVLLGGVILSLLSIGVLLFPAALLAIASAAAGAVAAADARAAEEQSASRRPKSVPATSRRDGEGGAARRRNRRR